MDNDLYEEKFSDDETPNIIETQKSGKTSKQIQRERKATREEIKEKIKQKQEEEIERSKEIERLSSVSNKLYRQKIVEQADLQTSIETFGIEDDEDEDDPQFQKNYNNIDLFKPVTVKDYKHFAQLLADKIFLYQNEKNFKTFFKSILHIISQKIEQITDLKELASFYNDLIPQKIEDLKKVVKQQEIEIVKKEKKTQVRNVYDAFADDSDSDNDNDNDNESNDNDDNDEKKHSDENDDDYDFM
ncbi:eukaryotic translation initiation factor 3 subunit j [Anaeramoeba ignava]|uniref:Eukaryotic translation initiation factor 3 subunit j n=1 Tax=Anaeramoeba ignava TaxID=1746090 RepID=A0A9Q0LCK5_ANAIG|nr:eukaryotic translation initiation factor 3 subunit j [Anaeramoeba ignava]